MCLKSSLAAAWRMTLQRRHKHGDRTLCEEVLQQPIGWRLDFGGGTGGGEVVT